MAILVLKLLYRLKKDAKCFFWGLFLLIFDPVKKIFEAKSKKIWWGGSDPLQRITMISEDPIFFFGLRPIFSKEGCHNGAGFSNGEEDGQQTFPMCKKKHPVWIMVFFAKQILLKILFCNIRNFCNEKFKFSGFCTRKMRNLREETIFMTAQWFSRPKFLSFFFAGGRLHHQIHKKTEAMPSCTPQHLFHPIWRRITAK